VYLVAGLGNPGPKYEKNRHNVGFRVVERFAQDHHAPAFRDRFQGRFAKLAVSGHDVVLLEPLTYMNLSGRSVQQALHFFKLPRTALIAVYDELDLPFGTVRIKVGGGTAGHRGVASIMESCGGQDFCRLRVGIGRPRSGTVENFVLGDFSSEESARLSSVLESASAALTDIVIRGATAAMNLHNQKAETSSG
jgi:peptidyl-tRNA hydrolase, PTH1 family